MLRNKQEEKRKALRKIYKRYMEIDYRGIDYVPIEKPYFIGWDVSIGLSESGARRRDAPELQAVLDALGASKKNFTKGVRYVRFLRRFKYSVEEIEAGIHSYQKRNRFENIPYWFQSLWNYSVSKHTYNNLPVHIQKYFYFSKDDCWWAGWKHGDCYRLKFPFPTYELVYKVEKSYANYQGIPRGEEWSENDYLSKILDDNHYWTRKYGNSKSTYKNKSYRRWFNVYNRRAWKSFCHSMKNSDFSDEAEELSRKHLKNQKYKW